MLYCIIMKFADWFPYYQGIRADFGYSTEKDQEAARIPSARSRARMSLW
jgi:uncharacterized Rossmann fold enzyme